MSYHHWDPHLKTNTTQTGFAGYWLRDPSRSSPQPLPIDVLLGVGRFMQRAHESVPGIWVREVTWRAHVLA